MVKHNQKICLYFAYELFEFDHFVKLELKGLSLRRRLACQILPKALISSATAWVTSDLLKALAVLSDTTKEWYFLAVDLSPAFLNTGTTDETFKNLENKNFSDPCWRVQPVCMKVQAHSSLEPPIQSGRDAFDKSRFGMTFLTFLGVMVILCSFRWVLEGKTGKEIPESSRLEFFQKF